MHVLNPSHKQKPVSKTYFFRPEDTYSSTFTIPSATQTSSTTPATMSQNNIAMVPVHQEDFKKFNEFAEAAWICRDLENADRIKEIRKTLLKEVTIILFLKRC